MPNVNHVLRRRAVYIWRRGLPAGFSERKRQFVQISLQTKAFSTAVLLGPLVNVALNDMVKDMSTEAITLGVQSQHMVDRVKNEPIRL